MKTRNWKKQGDALTLTTGPHREIRLIYGAEQSLILSGRNSYSLETRGNWIRRFRVIKDKRSVAEMIYRYFDRKSTLHTESGTNFLLVSSPDGSLRWLDSQSDCLVWYPDPFRTPREICFLPDQSDLDILLGLTMAIGMQIAEELQDHPPLQAH